MAISRFIKKPSLPSLTGWPNWAFSMMNPIKQTIEIITGRRGEKLDQLSGNISIDAVAEKVNEIIRVLQDGPDTDVSVDGVSAPPPVPTPQVTINNITETTIQQIVSGASAFWTPADLPDLTLWLDASDDTTLTLSGAAVEQWDDKSDAARHAAQLSATRQPTRVTNALNGKPVIHFDGVDDYLLHNEVTSRAVFVLMRWTTTTGDYRPLLGSETVKWEWHGASQASGALFDSSLASSHVQGAEKYITGASESGALYRPTTWHIMEFMLGGNVFSDTISTDRTLTGRYLYGDIAEIVILDGTETGQYGGSLKLKDEFRWKVEGYLAWKWGLQDMLPSDHPYRYDGSLFGYIRISKDTTKPKGRNALVNAQMRIGQRRQSGNYTSNNTPTMMLDQWVIRAAPGSTPVYAFSRSTASVPTEAQAGVPVKYALRLNLTTANNSLATNQYVKLFQPLEWSRWAQVYRKPFTLSFWIRATTVGTYTAYVTLGNSDGAQAYVSRRSFRIYTTNTWELKVLNFGICPVLAPSTDSTYVAEVGILLAAGTDLTGGSLGTDQGEGWYGYTAAGTCDPNQVNGCATGSTDVYFTLPQLEPGVAASPFEWLPAVEELQNCWRYCESSYPDRYVAGTAALPGGMSVFGADYPSSDTYVLTAGIQFRVEKRQTAGKSITVYSLDGTSGNATRLVDNTNQSMSGTWDISEKGAKLNFTLGSSEADTRRAFHWIYMETDYT